jgi:50S ribosomal subunit-associated GTPase HflX
MKKLLIIILLFISGFNISFANNSDIYNKIDLIYDKNPEKLNDINKKINQIILTSNNKKIKLELKNINDYINYKFKNIEYYNQNITQKTKDLIKNIKNNSYTDRKIVENIEDLLKNNQFSQIDKEYIEYVKISAEISTLLNHQNFD